MGLYARGSFETAAREFQLAWELSRRPEMLHNMYLAYRDAGMLVKAAEALRRYLEADDSLEEDRRVHLEGRLEALDRTIAEQEDTARRAAEPRVIREEGPSPVPFILMGTGGAMLVGAAVTGVLALNAEQQLAERCPMDVCEYMSGTSDEVSSGLALAITTDVLLGLGAATVLVGLGLLVFGGEDEPVEAALGCTTDGCRGAVRGSF